MGGDESKDYNVDLRLSIPRGYAGELQPPPWQVPQRSTHISLVMPGTALELATLLHCPVASTQLLSWGLEWQAYPQ